MLPVVLILTYFSYCSAYYCGKYLQNTLKYRSAIKLSSSTSPLQLNVDEIAARWNVIKYGEEGQKGIELLDKYLADRTVKIRLPRVGGLGLNLFEYGVDKGDTALVLVGGVIPESNAAACKQFQVGDALHSISSVPREEGEEPLVTDLEGLTLDDTMEVLARYSDYEEVTLAVKRIIKRGEVLVQMIGPKGKCILCRYY
jgi:hypothetical protein